MLPSTCCRHNMYTFADWAPASNSICRRLGPFIRSSVIYGFPNHPSPSSSCSTSSSQPTSPQAIVLIRAGNAIIIYASELYRSQTDSQWLAVHFNCHPLRRPASSHSTELSPSSNSPFLIQNTAARVASDNHATDWPVADRQPGRGKKWEFI